MRLRLSLLTLLLTCTIGNSHAQQQIYYGYDAAGNRTMRTTYNIYQSRSLEETEENGEADNSLAPGWRVTVAPNPTHGLVQVMVSGLGGFDSCTLTLFSASGQAVLTMVTKQVLTTIDMTSLANGLYLFRTDIDGTAITTKVIKQN